MSDAFCVLLQLKAELGATAARPVGALGAGSEQQQHQQLVKDKSGEGGAGDKPTQVRSLQELRKSMSGQQQQQQQLVQYKSGEGGAGDEPTQVRSLQELRKSMSGQQQQQLGATTARPVGALGAVSERQQQHLGKDKSAEGGAGDEPTQVRSLQELREKMSAKVAAVLLFLALFLLPPHPLAPSTASFMPLQSCCWADVSASRELLAKMHRPPPGDTVSRHVNGHSLPHVVCAAEWGGGRGGSEGVCAAAGGESWGG